MYIINLLQFAAIFILVGYILTVIPGALKNGAGKTGKNRDNQPAGENGRGSRFVLLVLVMIVSVIFVRDVIVGSTPFGTTTIDGVLEKRDYVTDYYVLAFPEGSSSLNYKVAAEIHAYIRNVGLDRFRIYKINRIHWPEGGSITFVKSAASDYSLEPDQAVFVTDDNGRKWKIQLTKEKVQ